MTTVEELQSMTHEDLVRRVQELEQDLKEVVPPPTGTTRKQH